MLKQKWLGGSCLVGWKELAVSNRGLEEATIDYGIQVLNNSTIVPYGPRRKEGSYNVVVDDTFE